jgi:hypothetical protein
VYIVKDSFHVGYQRQYRNITAPEDKRELTEYWLVVLRFRGKYEDYPLFVWCDMWEDGHKCFLRSFSRDTIHDLDGVWGQFYLNNPQYAQHIPLKYRATQKFFRRTQWEYCGPRCELREDTSLRDTLSSSISSTMIVSGLMILPLSAFPNASLDKLANGQKAGRVSSSIAQT